MDKGKINKVRDLLERQRMLEKAANALDDRHIRVGVYGYCAGDIKPTMSRIPKELQKMFQEDIGRYLQYIEKELEEL